MSISKIEEIRLEEFKNSLDGMGMDENSEYNEKKYTNGFNKAVELIKEEFKKFFPNL